MTDLPDRPAGVANDLELLNALLARWRPYLIVVARRRMGYRPLRMWATAHDDDDIVQEALLRAARYVRHYDPARGTFRQFLCLQIHTVCIELFRLAARQQRSRRPDVGFTERDRLTRRPDRRFAPPATVAEANDFWEHAGRTLEPEERTILRMRHREGLMRRQIADVLSISEDAVYYRDTKLKQKLAAAGI